MDTGGHHSIAEEVGNKVFEKALESIRKKHLNTTSFYMGNWLADMSQLVDPVAYEDVSDFINEILLKISDEVEAIIRKGDFEIFGFKFGVSDYFDLKKLIREKDKVHLRLKAVFDEWFISATPNPRESEVGVVIKEMVFFLGYFKFVSVEGGLEFKAYQDIFDEVYTQYYPHEHLDRPVVSENPVKYASKTDKGTRSSKRRIEFKKDLYTYLRDGIEIIAGSFSDLDLNWASKVFRSSGKVSSNDKIWYLNLAKFGHSIHAVEDFFAHSNFIELAASALEKDYKRRFYEIESKGILEKRLKSLPNGKPVDDDDPVVNKLPREDFVVTGYFDKMDTLNSLAHNLLNLMGHGGTTGLGHKTRHLEDDIGDLIEDPEYKKKKLQKDINEKYLEAQKLLTDTAEFVINHEDAKKDAENSVAKYLDHMVHGFTAEDVAKELCDRAPLLREADKAIQIRFIHLIELLSRAKKIYGYSLTIYEVLSGIRDFVHGPSKWLKKFLLKYIGEKLADSIVHHIQQEVFQGLLKSTRIGCHSLLAKDHGNELFFEEQKSCAMAVHWYIVSSMLRHCTPSATIVSKAQLSESGAKKHINVVNSYQWIDWLELLEYFLRNPSGENESELQVSYTHKHKVVKGDSLASLGKQYRPTAIDPSSFRWETIADHNYSTGGMPHKDRCDRINEILKHSNRGVRVGNQYAFKEGILVEIPFQSRWIPRPALSEPERAWFVPVMKYGWEAIDVKEFDKLKKISGQYSSHTYMTVDREYVEGIAARGEKLRIDAEASYMPNRSRYSSPDNENGYSGNDYNAKVLEFIHANPLTGEGFAASSTGKWVGTGVPEEILHSGRKILSKSTIGTYCCGYTFWVAYKVATSENLLAVKSVEQVRQMQREWYGNVTVSSVEWERQCAVALGNIGIGQQVPLDEAKPGDFVQFWRDHSGHSVVFLEWTYENGERSGIRYRSSQKSTNGVGDRTELFRGKGGSVDPGRIYVGRMMV